MSRTPGETRIVRASGIRKPIPAKTGQNRAFAIDLTFVVRTMRHILQS